MIKKNKNKQKDVRRKAQSKIISKDNKSQSFNDGEYINGDKAMERAIKNVNLFRGYKYG